MEERITAYSQELRAIYDPHLRQIKGIAAKIDRLELEQAKADRMMQYVESISAKEIAMYSNVSNNTNNTNNNKITRVTCQNLTGGV